MKVLPQFADQVVVIFLSFPRLCMKSSLVTSTEIHVFFCCSAGFHGSIWNIRCHSHLHIFFSFFLYGCLYIVVVHFPGILNKIIDKFPGTWQYKHWSSFFLSWVSASNSVLRWMLFYCGGCCFTAVDIVFHCDYGKTKIMTNIKKVKFNESRYIVLFVVNRPIKKLFWIVSILILSQYFSKLIVSIFINFKMLRKTVFKKKKKKIVKSFPNSQKFFRQFLYFMQCNLSIGQE